MDELALLYCGHDEIPLFVHALDAVAQLLDCLLLIWGVSDRDWNFFIQSNPSLNR